MSIVLSDLTKRYENQPVVNRLSLEIEDGEFFVLIGPSGSGKSTVLRMIAGLNAVDEGRISLHGRDVTHAPPQQRNVGFVFQNYALFRHMTVGDNIEFALRVRRVAAAERRRRRDELLELVGLAGLGKRLPAQLSGGQQQRVALARALAHRPEVLLLDEPFGALDAKIRVDLRRALRAIQRELKITTIFVTHDQEEAFELADRVGVMNFGRLLEAGAATELYQHPQTEFVATFLGAGTLLAGALAEGVVTVGELRWPLTTEAGPGGAEQPVQVLFRPEDVRLAPEPAGAAPVLGQGVVEHTTFAGAFERTRVRLPVEAGLRPISPPVPFGEASFLVEALRPLEAARQAPLNPGDSVWVGVSRAHVLAHRGLSFLMVHDSSPEAQAALVAGGQLARVSHARVTLLSHGQPAEVLAESQQAAKEILGSGLAGLDLRTSPEPLPRAVRRALEQQPCDLVVAGCRPNGRHALARRLVAAGAENILLVAQPGTGLPRRALLAVRGSEPSKDEVRLAGSLLYYLGAQATLLSVVDDDAGPATHERSESFLRNGARTLAALGVSAQTRLRAGEVDQAILDEIKEGEHDLLLLGVPLAELGGPLSLGGIVAQLLESPLALPILITRSPYAVSQPLSQRLDGRIHIVEDMVV